MTVTSPPEFPAPAAPVAPPLKPRRQTRSFASLRTIMALILREMSTTYGKSPGGYLWAVLEPLAGIFIMVLIFSAGFRNPPIGSSFPIFFATGIVPFTMFMQLSGRIGGSILFSKSLLAYPAVTYIDAVAARFILNAVVQLLINYTLITAIIVLQDVPVALRFSRILLGYAEIMALALGIGLFNAFLGGMFPIWLQIWSIITRPLFLISGVLFIYETLPRPFNEYMLYNPLTHAIATIRSGFYARYDAAYADPVFVFAVAGITGITGLVFLHRYHKDILYR
jgi:capsular polysaccharide transport system permease protein